MTPHVHHWLVDAPDRAVHGRVAARCTVDGCPEPRRTFATNGASDWMEVAFTVKERTMIMGWGKR